MTGEFFSSHKGPNVKLTLASVYSAQGLGMHGPLICRPLYPFMVWCLVSWMALQRRVYTDR